MPTLSLSVLGPFAASLDERPLTQFRTKSVQALLVYLACQPEVHRREQLMTLLWPDIPQQSAQGSLRQSLYLLRQAIPELPARDGSGMAPLLLADRQTVQMNPNGRFDLDLHTFTDTLKGDESGWAEAVTLYRGDFLADFYLPDSAPFEEWVNARRADLRRRALEALETLTDYAMQIGDLATAETYARRQLEIDNLRERAHRQLMEVFARNGRRRAAISQYKALSQLLHEELAIEPTASTQALHEAIRSGKFDGTAVPPPLPPIAVIPNRPENNHNLPTQATPFFGREAELSALNEFMTNQGARLITIVGPGGMGKTRLALETARQQMGNFTHGVWFASLAKLSSPDEIVPATAQALHFSFYEGGTPRQQLLDYLRNKSLLLIMDNYEHLLEGADLVSDVLQNAPQVNVLVTSREPLHLVEEQLFPLSGLTFSREDVVEGDAAVQLFLERARHLRPDLTLKPDDLADVTIICQQVEGMPLGLELAATWVDTLSLAEIAAELQQGLDLLESDMRNIADRHRSLRTVFEASWDRLHPDEQQLFAQLSVFRGGFTRTAAKEICAPDLSQPGFHRLLAALTRKSFLKHDMENGRYDIHELMRQYGAEKLAEDEEQETAARHRHAAYYCEFLHQLGEDLKGPRQMEALRELEIDVENGRVAWKWAVKHKLINFLQKAIIPLFRFLVGWRMRYLEADNLFELLVENLNEHESILTRQLLITTLLCQATCKERSGQHEDENQLRQRAQKILTTSTTDGMENWAGKAFVLLRLAVLVSVQDSRRELCLQGLELTRHTGDNWYKCAFLTVLGVIAFRQGRYDEAGELLEESSAGARLLSDKASYSEAVTWLSRVKQAQSRLEEAEYLAKEGLVIARDMGALDWVAHSLDRLGSIYLYGGRYKRAIKTFRARLQIYEEIGSHFGIPFNYFRLSHTYLHAGEYTKSKDAAEICLQKSKDYGNHAVHAHALTILGNGALVEGDQLTAVNYFEESETIMLSLAEPDVLRWYLGYYVVTLVHCGKLIKARQKIIVALEAKVQGPLRANLIAAIALFYWAEKRWERAIELYALACQHPYVRKSHWMADTVGKYIGQAALALPSDAVEAAKMRGQEMDVWETAASLLAEFSEQD